MSASSLLVEPYLSSYSANVQPKRREAESINCEQALMCAMRLLDSGMRMLETWYLKSATTKDKVCRRACWHVAAKPDDIDGGRASKECTATNLEQQPGGGEGSSLRFPEAS